MLGETRNDEMKTAYRKKMGTNQNTINYTFETEQDTVIGKILCVNAKSYIDNVEVLNGEAHYDGEVYYNVLFSDAQGTLCSMEGKSPLTGKIENIELNTSMHPIVSATVVDVKVAEASSREMKVTAIVEVVLDCIKQDEVNTYQTEDENIAVKRGGLKYNYLSFTGTSTFNVEEEQEVKGQINKVLCTNAEVCVKNVFSGTGYFTVEGEVYTSVMVEVGEEERELKNLCTVTTFKEEIEAEEANKDSVIQLTADVLNRDVKSEINILEDGKNSIVTTVPVCVKFVGLNSREDEVILDAYSLTNKTNLVSETIYAGGMYNSKHFKERIDGSMVLADDEPRIRKILGVCGEKIVLANNIPAENNLTVEGIAYANVVYLTEEDDNNLNSVQLEVPFSVSLDYAGMSGDDDVSIKASILDVNCKSKKGKEIDLEFEVGFFVETFSMTQDVVIKDLEIAEPLKEKDYSIQIYMAKAGDDAWSLGKKLNVLPETVLKFNPALELPLQKNESIVLYK